MSFKVDIKIVDHSRRAMRETSTLTHRRMTDELIETFVEIAKERSPVRIGNNKSSISYTPPGVLHWRVATHSGYGGWLEFGTERMPARPYFAPAFQIANKEFKAKGGRWI